MARRIREHDWAATPLGPSQHWPAALRTAIEFALPSPVPILVSWALPPSTFYNDAFIPLAGARHPQILGRSVQQHWPELAAQGVSVIARIQAGESVVLRGPILDVVRDGETTRETFDVGYWPLLDSEGRARGLMAAVTRGAELEAASADLLRQTRFREFADASPDALWILDAKTLALEYAGPAFEQVFGIAPARLMGARGVDLWVDLIHPDDRATVVADYNRTRAGERVRHEYRIIRPSDGVERWIGTTDFPLFDGPGAAAHIGGIASDVTEARRAAAHNQVLVAELQHRSRNLLAVVGAVAARTLRLGGDYAGFERRLKALSRAQGLLSVQGSETVDVGDLIRGELAAHADGAGSRISVEGPPAALSASQVQNLALVIHELTTNAVKYGALAQPQARLTIRWQVTGAPAVLTLDWRESGVRVEPSGRSGFGRELIERVAAAAGGGTPAHYRIEPDGVSCRLAMPL